MKHVLKGTEPASFTDWKASANDDWSPVYAILQNPQKKDLHNSLILEQGALCCYCGREIDLGTSHIEHFRPQEHYPELALEYQNLHASCLRETRPGNPLHCGHHKSNWFEENQHIAPTDNGCEQRFRYLLSGEIQAADAADSPAKRMIDILALDVAYLSNRRREVIQRLFDDEFLVQGSDEDMEKIIDVLRSVDVADQKAFDHVIARFAEQLLGRQTKAPGINPGAL